MSQKLPNMLESTIQKIREMVDVNSVMGEPIHTPDGVTIIPVSKVSVGFGGGGTDFATSKNTENPFGGGVGGGVKVTPLCFLIIQDGNVRMIQLSAENNAVERAVSMIPELVDKLSDLLTGDYIAQVRSLLPEDHALYLYSFPRMSAEGVTYFYNEYESETRRAYTESYLLTFDELGDAVNRTGECYAALHTPYTRIVTVAGFQDVPVSYWAADYIQQVRTDQLMVGGTNGLFRPNDTISGAEVCATIARSEKLTIPETPLEGIDVDAWYAGSLSAVQTAGLLDGVQLDPERAIFREDAMQIFANLLVRRGKTMPDEKQTAKTLAKFADTYQLSENRRAAAALCVQEGLIQGSGNRLTPRSSFTRAEFAKLLTLIQK